MWILVTGSRVEGSGAQGLVFGVSWFRAYGFVPALIESALGFRVIGV